MSAFDTVQLEPITEPIPPEPTFPWGPLLVTSLWVILGIALVVSTLWIFLLLRKRSRLQRNVVEVKWMRLGLKQYQKSLITADSLDVDLWWETLQLYLVRKGYIAITSPSIEEVRIGISEVETFKHLLQMHLLELIALVEREKYEGKRSKEDRERMLELFVKVYQEFIAIESETH